MKHVKWLVIILFGALLIIVISQNMQTLKTPVIFIVDLWPFETYQSSQIPLGFVATLAFCIGVLLMAACGIIERFRLKKQVRTLLKETREIEKELASLKNMQVTSDVYDLEPATDSN